MGDPSASPSLGHPAPCAPPLPSWRLYIFISQTRGQEQLWQNHIQIAGDSLGTNSGFGGMVSYQAQVILWVWRTKPKTFAGLLFPDHFTPSCQLANRIRLSSLVLPDGIRRQRDAEGVVQSLGPPAPLQRCPLDLRFALCVSVSFLAPQSELRSGTKGDNHFNQCMLTLGLRTSFLQNKLLCCTIFACVFLYASNTEVILCF